MSARSESERSALTALVPLTIRLQKNLIAEESDHESETGKTGVDEVDERQTPEDGRVAKIHHLLSIDRVLTLKEMTELLSLLRTGDPEDCYDEKLVDSIVEEHHPAEVESVPPVP